MSKTTAYARPQVRELAGRLLEPRRFIQVVAGSRQVGKTTLVQQAAGEVNAVARRARPPAPVDDWLHAP